MRPHSLPCSGSSGKTSFSIDSLSGDTVVTSAAY